MEYNLQIRYILIGSSYAGKSCIMEQYIDRYFSLGPPRTIGVDFNSTDTSYTISGNRYNVNNHIFDTSGDIKIFTLCQSYISMAKCVLLVFDLTDLESFNNLKKWHLKIIEESNGTNRFILIGNKKDLQKNKINKKLISNYANKSNMEYIEVSAKSKSDIDNLFNKLNMDLITEFIALSHERRIKSPIIRDSYRPNINPEKNTRCCFKICNIS